MAQSPRDQGVARSGALLKIFSLPVPLLGCFMAGNLLVYGLAAAMVGIVVWWAFDTWGEAKRRRSAPKDAIDESEQVRTPGTGVQPP